MTPAVLRLGTRASALAMAQSRQVADAVTAATGVEVVLVPIRTEGDVNAAPLVTIGGTGVFVAAVREALLAHRVDLVVHSFKDLPTAAVPGIRLGAVPHRERSTDALCSAAGDLGQLPDGARVGTGSPRRAGQLLRRRPDLQVEAIRGNVDSRLARVGADLAAVVLATAGLHRLGLDHRITQELADPVMLPAPAQGALAVECREDADGPLAHALRRLDHADDRAAALAERAVLRELQAGCSAPVSALARCADGRLLLTARVTAPDGSAEITEQAEGPVPGGPGSGTPAADAAAEAVGVAAARQLLAAGAGPLVDSRPGAGLVVDGRPLTEARPGADGTAP